VVHFRDCPLLAEPDVREIGRSDCGIGFCPLISALTCGWLLVEERAMKKLPTVEHSVIPAQAEI